MHRNGRAPPTHGVGQRRSMVTGWSSSQCISRVSGCRCETRNARRSYGARRSWRRPPRSQRPMPCRLDREPAWASSERSAASAASISKLARRPGTGWSPARQRRCSRARAFAVAVRPPPSRRRATRASGGVGTVVLGLGRVDRIIRQPGSPIWICRAGGALPAGPGNATSVFIAIQVPCVLSFASATAGTAAEQPPRRLPAGVSRWVLPSIPSVTRSDLRNNACASSVSRHSDLESTAT